MENPNDETVQILKNINDTLEKIFECFEDKYSEVLKQKIEKKEKFVSTLKDPRKKIFILLFDEKNLSQVQIAEMVKVSRQAVNLFVNKLLEEDIIEQKNEDGTIKYIDKYNLLKKLN